MDISDSSLWLWISLVILIALSAFFSSSETGMMAINRYKLKHLVKQKNANAIRVSKLLERPDRLIGVILIGNNFVNNAAVAIATILAIGFFGEALGPMVSTIALTIVVLIFGEVTPKTMAALNPEKIAYPASLILTPLLKILYPLVWLVNGISNAFLAVFGIKVDSNKNTSLNLDELRTVVHEAGGMIPPRHTKMLLSIMELGNVTVEDIMIPRKEIIGIDLNDSIEEILQQIKDLRHTRIPVYHEDINNIVGILHIRAFVHLNKKEKITKADLMKEIIEPYFVLESTPLYNQLLNFQKEQRRIAIVVDEYGDIEGLVTLEEILEEIVGDFTTDTDEQEADIVKNSDNSFMIDASATIREINKALNWHLSTAGAKTLNGLLLEHLESIPDANVCIKIGDYCMETIEVKENLINKVKCTKISNLDE